MQRVLLRGVRRSFSSLTSSEERRAGLAAGSVAAELNELSAAEIDETARDLFEDDDYEHVSISLAEIPSNEEEPGSARPELPAPPTRTVSMPRLRLDRNAQMHKLMVVMGTELAKNEKARAGLAEVLESMMTAIPGGPPVPVERLLASCRDPAEERVSGPGVRHSASAPVLEGLAQEQKRPPSPVDAAASVLVPPSSPAPSAPASLSSSHSESDSSSSSSSSEARRRPWLDAARRVYEMLRKALGVATPAAVPVIAIGGAVAVSPGGEAEPIVGDPIEGKASSQAQPAPHLEEKASRFEHKRGTRGDQATSSATGDGGGGALEMITKIALGVAALIVTVAILRRPRV